MCYVMFMLYKSCYRNLGCFLLKLFPSVRCLQPAINETPVEKDEYLPITLIEKMMLIKMVESLLRSPVHTGTLSCQLLYGEIILKEQELLTTPSMHTSKHFFFWQEADHCFISMLHLYHTHSERIFFSFILRMFSVEKTYYIFFLSSKHLQPITNTSPENKADLHITNEETSF